MQKALEVIKAERAPRGYGLRCVTSPEQTIWIIAYHTQN